MSDSDKGKIKMKNMNFKKPMINILLISMMTSTLWGCSKSSSLEPTLPESWYRLTDSSDETLSPRAEGKLRYAVDTIYHANNQALENMDSSATFPQDANGKPADWVPWHLGGLITDISISSTGVLGFLLMNGTASIQANWARKSTKPVNETLRSENQSSFAGLTVHASSDPVLMSRQLELVTRAALATGKIKDEQALRMSINKSGEQFQSIAVMLSQVKVDQSKWSFDTFRLDLGIDGSGQITPIITAGVTIAFRMEWDRIRDGALTETNSFSPSLAPLNTKRNLGEFLNAVSNDLDEVTATASEELAGTGFKACTVRIGISSSVQGDVGIAKGTSTLR